MSEIREILYIHIDVLVISLLVMECSWWEFKWIPNLTGEYFVSTINWMICVFEKSSFPPQRHLHALEIPNELHGRDVMEKWNKKWAIVIEWFERGGRKSEIEWKMLTMLMTASYGCCMWVGVWKQRKTPMSNFFRATTVKPPKKLLVVNH